jgi:hypothetical protein
LCDAVSQFRSWPGIVKALPLSSNVVVVGRLEALEQLREPLRPTPLRTIWRIRAGPIGVVIARAYSRVAGESKSTEVSAST